MDMVLAKAGPVRGDGNASVITRLEKKIRTKGHTVFSAQRRGGGENM